MSIKISRDQALFGIPAMKLRNAFQQLDDGNIKPEWFAGRIGISNADSRRLADELIEAGWLAYDENGSDRLRMTQEGRRLIHARATRPLKRVKARSLLEGAVQAAREINADGTMTHFVEELYVFGSYLGDSAEIGDLDLGYKLGRRLGKIAPDDWIEWCKNVGHAKLKSSSYTDVLFYSEKMVLRRIKQRSPYVSLHSLDDLDQIEAKRELIFEKRRVAAPRPR